MAEESVADALERIADRLESTLAEARLAHEAFASLPRGLDAMADEILVQRTRVSLFTGVHLVRGLREESQSARRRAPDLTVSGTRLPPRPSSDEPRVVASWWAGLTEAEQENVIVTDPMFAGSADGLPAAVRHRVNLILLDSEIERRMARGDAAALRHAPAHTEGDPDQSDETESFEDFGQVALEDAVRGEQDERDLRGLLKLRALLMPHTVDDLSGIEDGARDALKRVSTPPQDRHLYLLDAGAYPLKAIVVLGDLETAEHVVLHVPGATTTVDLRLFREAAWLSNLRAEAGRHVDIGNVAVVDWIGYQAPVDIAVRRPLGDSGLPLIMPGEAADARYAHEAVPAFTRCAAGLRVLIGPDADLVASGHSYGGSVVGLALADTDVFDRAMVAGCPGLFTNDADDLHLLPEALFAVTAPGDVVALLGVFGGPTHQVAGIRMISARTRSVAYPDGTRALLRPTFGHESYYNAASTTLHGLGAVAAGALDQVRTTRRVQRSSPLAQGATAGSGQHLD